MLERSSADTRDDARPEMAPRPINPQTSDPAREPARPARESGEMRHRDEEVKEPSTEALDVVQDASDDSFPASDPPSWIDVWL